jgi:uncharacterized protein YjbI with pentapeptide repeats
MSMLEALAEGGNYAEGLTFTGEDLSADDPADATTAADLTQAEFTGCIFDHCLLSGVQLKRASLTDCTFKGCDLSNAKAHGTWWVGCSLRSCRLDGIELVEALLRGCSFDGCSAIYANLGKAILERTSIVDSRCKEAFVQEARLKRVTFDAVDLTRADFFRTSLKGVDLSGCTIDGISVSEDFHELKGAKVSPEQAVGLAMLLGVTIV